MWAPSPGSTLVRLACVHLTRIPRGPPQCQALGSQRDHCQNMDQTPVRAAVLAGAYILGTSIQPWLTLSFALSLSHASLSGGSLLREPPAALGTDQLLLTRAFGVRTRGRMAAGLEGGAWCIGRTRAAEGGKTLGLGEELEQRPGGQVWSLAQPSPF